MKYTKKDLIAVATEFNTLMFDEDDGIDTSLSEEGLRKQIIDASEELLPEDVLSDLAESVLRELGCARPTKDEKIVFADDDDDESDPPEVIDIQPESVIETPPVIEETSSIMEGTPTVVQEVEAPPTKQEKASKKKEKKAPAPKPPKPPKSDYTRSMAIVDILTQHIGDELPKYKVINEANIRYQEVTGKNDNVLSTAQAFSCISGALTYMGFLKQSLKGVKIMSMPTGILKK